MTLLETATVTCTAPVNIALIKYWGKRDEKLLLPINSSLSVTLNQDTLCSRTSVRASTSYDSDRFWLNGQECDLNATRTQNVLREIKARAQDYVDEDGNVVFTKDQWSKLKLRIVSENNFPTAAGLASSASGFACLVYTLAKLYGVKESFPGELTRIARVGSGSACRSLGGGFVRWNRGQNDDGEDSFAEEVYPQEHWPDMQIVILVVNAGKKGVSSTSGMMTSVKTSPLLAHRAESVVPQRCQDIETAIKARDFETLGRITMQESNQFHACCLDTYPPIFYLNDTSRSIIHMVDRYNEACGRIKIAYTFDAGPNAVLLCEKDTLSELGGLVAKYFPCPADMSSEEYFRGAMGKVAGGSVEEIVSEKINMDPLPAGSVKYVMHTTVGDGPRNLGADAKLMDETSGTPLRMA